MIQTLPDSTVQLADMESSLQELKKLVSWGWTYAVIWKIAPDHRTPVWHQSYLNELAEVEVGAAQRFESIYRQCQFTPARPGYAYLAWQRQSPLWWTRLMEPVLTDKSKELFLAQAGIQTIVCFPGRAVADGTRYCIELACTGLVSETELLRTSIQEFLNTSIDPYISTTTSSLLLPQELLDSSALVMDSSSTSPALAMAALAHQTSAILTDITSQASMAEDEEIEGYGNILRTQEPYLPWTMSTSHYVSAGLQSNFQTFGDLTSYPNFQSDVPPSFSYGGSPLLEPYHEIDVENIIQAIQPSSEWTSTSSSRKGKGILVEESSLNLSPGLHNLSTLLQQQDALERLRSPPSAPPSLAGSVVPSAQVITSQNTSLSSGNISTGYRPSTMRAVTGKMLPGHSPRSLFQPHRQHLQAPRFQGVSKKRQPLIHKWATSLMAAHRNTVRMRESELIPGGGTGSSFDGSPGTDTVFDPRSPNSVAHDHQAAVAHKIAERNRRLKFSHKLQTLISIVPMTNKKKDKVSVLSSTIDYIRQLNLRISNLRGVESEAAAPSTSLRIEEGATTSATMDREEELTMFNDVEGAQGPSSSSMVATQPVVVVVESSGEDTWVIKVEANYRTRSLIQLLNVLLELELGIVTVDYGSMNGRFHANICVKSSRNLSMSSSELQATLCRVLETSDSPLTGSD